MLQAIPKGRTLVKAEFKPTTQVDLEMLSNSVPTIREGAMLAKDKRLDWAQGELPRECTPAQLL